MDSKHVALKLPLDNGYLYFNYREYFSIILMVTCNGRYVLKHIDIGSYGSNNGSGTFRNSKMREQFFKNKEHLPEADSLEECSISEKVLCYLVRHEAFPL